MEDYTTVIIHFSSGKGKRASFLLLLVLQPLENNPAERAILLRCHCMGRSETIVECGRVRLLGWIVRGLSAYWLLVSHRTWDCAVNLIMAVNCFVWDSIVDVAREEESWLLSFALSGGSGWVLGRWTVLKWAVILRTLRYLHQVEKIVRLVHLVVK